MLFALPLVPLSLFLVVHLLLNFDSSLFYSLGFFFQHFLAILLEKCTIDFLYCQIDAALDIISGSGIFTRRRRTS